MSRTNYRTVSNLEPWGRNAAIVLQGAIAGRTNNVFDANLATGTAVTQLAFPLIGPYSHIAPVPTNTYAATLGVVWADQQTIGAAVLHHVTASATAGFRFTVIG